MKLWPYTCALALCAPALAHYNGNNAAKTIDKQATVLPNGEYRFVNVASGLGLTYVHSGQQLFAEKGKGSWLNIKYHEHHVVLSPTSSNDKCVSAQWNYAEGADWAGALYACSVTHFKRSEVAGQELEVRSVPGNVLDFEERDVQVHDHSRLEKRVGLRAAKQYFYVHAGAKHQYHIIAFDHITDQPARALADSSVYAVGSHTTKMVRLVALNNKDKHQLWHVYNKQGKLM